MNRNRKEFLELTESMCPDCGRIIQAALYEEGGQIKLRKFAPTTITEKRSKR